MKNLLFFCVFLLSFFGYSVEEPNKTTVVIEHYQIDSFEFENQEQIVQVVSVESYTKGHCTLQDSDGVSYTWTVGCFLCSPERANAKACSELSRLLQVTSLDPAPGCLCGN